jgi:DNA (cytosine-5)-methyltransferase 1
MLDVVRGLRPRYVLVENVAALLADAGAFGRVLGDLAALGFDAQWSVLSACALGAPHTRERLFLVAHPDRGDGTPRLGFGERAPAVPSDHLRPGAWLHPVDGFMEAAGRSRRVVDGAPDELEPARVRALGNAVVPQVAEHIGRMLMAVSRG